MIDKFILFAQAISDRSEIKLPNPSADSGQIGTVLSVVFMIAGATAVIVIIIGGIMYVTSAGDPQSTAKAKNTILYACIGLVVAILSNAIVALMLGKIIL